MQEPVITTTDSVKMSWSEIILRLVGVVLAIAGTLLLLLSIVTLLLATNGTRVRGTIVADSCEVSLGRGTTTSYECRGTFTPDDSSIPAQYFESNAGGGILVGERLETGVPYAGYAVGGFGDTHLSSGSQVVVDGDGQSQQSGFTVVAIFTVASFALIISGIAMCAVTTKKARIRRRANTPELPKISSASAKYTPDNITTKLEDPHQKLSVGATKVSGPLDSAVHGGGTLTLQDGRIYYHPKSQKVAPIDVSVDNIVKINTHKSRLELYMADGAHYSFTVTLPTGAAYAYIDASDPFDLILTAISLGDVATDAVESLKKSRSAQTAWEPWVTYITGRRPGIVIERKSRTPRLVLGIAAVGLLPLTVIAVIALSVGR